MYEVACCLRLRRAGKAVWPEQRVAEARRKTVRLRKRSDCACSTVPWLLTLLVAAALTPASPQHASAPDFDGVITRVDRLPQVSCSLQFAVQSLA